MVHHMTATPGRGWRWVQRPVGWTRRGHETAEAESRLVAVNLNRPHFRTARWWLLAEGVALLGLGLAGLIIGPSRDGGISGTVDWELALTPVHSWLLIGAGLLAALAALRRRTALAATTFGVITGLLMFAIGTGTLGTPASGHSALRFWHYRVGDSVLFCLLTAYNFALLLWLVANALEGPAWIRRPTDEACPPNDVD